MTNSFDIIKFLSHANNIGASDIHLKVGKPPAVRVSYSITKSTLPPLTDDDFDNILQTVLHKDLWDKARRAYNMDFTYEIEGLSRYRVNYCKDLGMPKLTLRVIPYAIPTLEELSLPESLKDFTKYNNGIVLITGATSSGKSTTIASLIDLINTEQAKHIITIEDPIEFLYTDKKSLITQRGIGIDVASFSSGIKYALRQDPDVIVVGEIRDRETMESALDAAETGHLVLSTIHTNSAVHTVNRIMGLFDDKSRLFVRERFANCLRGTIAQKLIPRADKGLVPALEILTNTPPISDYIVKNQPDAIYALVKKGGYNNMTTMNASIYSLYKAGLITLDSAMDASDDKNELGQMIRGIYHGIKDPTKGIM